MTKTEKNLSNDSTFLFVQAARAALFWLILLISLGSYLLQPSFINWSFLAPFYGVLILAFSLQVIWLATGSAILEKRPALYLSSFVVDGLILSFLIHYSGMSQSLFLFLHLVNILLAGVLFRTSGSLIVALGTSISYSLATLMGPELKPLQSLFMLGLNNVAFFSVAGLSGYLAEQLFNVKVELVKTGLSLESAEEFNRIILENIPAGVVTYDSSGLILDQNPVVQDIFGRTLEGSLYEYLPSLQTEATEGRRDCRFQAEEATEAKILSVSTRKFYSSALQKDLNIALIEDLTELRRLEYSTRQNEKLAAIGGLAAGIAHEIRNPLAGISGSIELLSQNANSDDDRKLMKIILREIDRLNNLITEFLDYSRPEVPPTTTVNLTDLLNEVMDSLAMNKQLRQDVQVQRQLDSGIMILGHSDKLRQAFLNIVINSFQAMQEVPQASLFIGLEKVDGLAKVKIKDSGVGMSEQTRKRMFEPFHTTKSKGTGLGLAVTHKILEGHKAQIFVESEKGVGTEFVLHFPLAQFEIK